MPFISLKNVSKGFGPARARAEVLRDINLSVEQGEFVAIVGYSGTGKTTLMSLVAGLIQPDAGQVTVNDHAVTGPSSELAIVFQNYSLLPWLSVYENVRLAIDQVFPKLTLAERRAKAEKYIGMVHLTPARDKRPAELSGGMRQRVSVARALAMEPEALLLDEPLSALDALTRATLQDEILKIWESQKRTVLLITNDVDEGILLADRIIPLTMGPGATLGPEFVIDLPRPRDRQAINHDAKFKHLRNEVISYLLHESGRHKTKLQLKLTLPDLLPEDLSAPRTLFGQTRQPRRRSEIKRESVEISS